MPTSRRPPIHKMPQSAFFEDKKGAAAGDQRSWTPLGLPAALLIGLAICSIVLYTNIDVRNPPSAIVDAALAANERIPEIEVILVRHCVTYYSVILLGPGEHWDRAGVYFRISNSGEIRSAELKFGDPRKGHGAVLALSAAGTLACLTGLWSCRRQIAAIFRGKRIGLR